MDPKLEIPTFNLLEFQVTYKTNRNSNSNLLTYVPLVNDGPVGEGQGGP